MCEHFVARAADPFRLEELWDLSARLERFGIAGFGWGAGWLTADRRLEVHRSTDAFRDDPARELVGRIETVAAVVHLRRPSRLSTLQLPDAQPFLDPAGRFVFSHNGDLRDVRDARRRYVEQGRIHGRADTEVGQRWLEDHWIDGAAPLAIARLHHRFGGQANVATLEPDGTACHYAGNTENPVFTFRLGRIGIAATGLYSLDRSLFTFAAPGATDRRLIRVGRTALLTADGTALDATPVKDAPIAVAM